MKRLNRQQIEDHAILTEDLVKAKDKVKLAMDELNVIVEKANDFTQEIYDEQQSYFDERSENWQDGDAGSAYSDWMTSWELELDVDDPGVDISDFENLPMELE